MKTPGSKPRPDRFLCFRERLQVFCNVFVHVFFLKYGGVAGGGSDVFSFIQI